MKKNLFLTAVIAVTALTFFGCQDPIKDLTITQTPGSAPEVAADSIIAKDLGAGNILVSWTDAENNGTYSVYRREIDEEGNPVGNGVQLQGPISRTATKKIPYYLDSGKANTSYQYGIVNRSYKTANDVVEISDIVWQDVGEGSYVKASATPITPTLVDNPTAPTVTVTPITADSYYAGYVPTGYALNPDYLVVEVKGLTYGYSYNFSTDYSNDANNSSTPSWHYNSSYSLVGWNPSSPSYNQNAFIAQTLGEDAPVFVGYISIGGTHSTNSSDPKEAVRIKVQYSGSGSNVLKVSHYDTSTSAIIKSGIASSDIEVVAQYTF